MNTLVLDKSALKAAPGHMIGMLRSRFSFLLTDILLHELVTEDLEKRDELSAMELASLNQKVDKHFEKALECAGNSWAEMRANVRWEVEKGQSARLGPRFAVVGTKLSDILSAEVAKLCVSYDAGKGAFLGMKHLVEDEQDFKKVRQINQQDLLEKMRQDFSAKSAIRNTAEESRKLFLKGAQELGWEISPLFLPTREWFSFGVYMVNRAYLPWKYHRYGDDQPQPKKPANPWFDLCYIGYIAIADGVLSADKELLKLAWALWPEKEDNIYYYDQSKHEPVRFVPEWLH